MISRRLRKLVLRAIPVDWRDTVERDLLEELSRRKRRGVAAVGWYACQTIWIGFAFRWRRRFGTGRPPRSRNPLDRLLVDLRHTWSTLRARRGSTLGTVGVLMIGIGLASAIFALADPFLLRPLPYLDPERLAIIHVKGLPVGETRSEVTSPLPTLADWRRRTDLFEDVAAFGAFERVRISTPGGSASLKLWEVSPNFLPLLIGLTPAAAWRPTPLGVPQAIAVTEQVAKGHLGLISAPVSMSLTAEDGARLDVVAILPVAFLFPFASMNYRPDALSQTEFPTVAWQVGTSTRYLTAVARLQPGATAPAVQAALGSSAANAGLNIRVEPLNTYMTAGLRPIALGALSAGLLIALVCAANVMNLLVARGMYRARDFATRQALGASRADLLRLIVLELGAIGASAVALSLLVARVTLAAVANVVPDTYLAVGEATITPRVALFTIALTAGIVAACALPAWFSARATSSAAISRARNDEPRTIRWWRFLLAAGQTAVAMVLLVGATFLARSYVNLWQQDTGYSRNARLVSVSYPSSRSAPQVMETMSATLEALRRVPGVANAAAGVAVGHLVDGYMGAGGPLFRAGGQARRIVPSLVTAGYFEVVGTPILAGRPLLGADRGWEAVVVNQAAAQRFWPSLPLDQVVGQPITGDGKSGRVVGVVQNAHDHTLDTIPMVRIYKPLETSPLTRMSYAIRLAPSILPSETVIRRAVISVDANAIVEDLDTPQGRLAESVRDRSFATLMLGLFASAGLGVTATGIFAVVAFVVARRTREIAIRMALGAGSGDVRRLVIRDAMMATLAGGVAGLLASHWLAKTIESHLYGVRTGDASTSALAVVGLLAVTALAAWWPTRRALRLEPTQALRVE